MRELELSDVFPFCRVLKAAGMRQEVASIIKQLSTGELTIDLDSVGLDTILRIVEGFCERGAEKAFYEFLSGPLECSAEEASHIKLLPLMEHLKQLINDPGLKSFFGLVAATIGQK